MTSHPAFCESCQAPLLYARVTNCAAPWHLEAVTGRENKMRGGTITAACAAKTRCPQGHPYDHANTYVYPNGERKCRACSRDYQRRLKARRKAAVA